jgi:hypothetical protein
LRKHIELVAENKNALVLLMGDLYDFIGPRDKRWDPGNYPMDMEIGHLGDIGFHACDTVEELTAPFRGGPEPRIITAIAGNHEGHFAGKHNANWHKEMCRRMGCLYSGYSAFLTLRFKERGNPGRRASLDVFAHHGSGAAQTGGGKLGRLEKNMAITNAPLVLMGHVHEQLSYSNVRLSKGKGKNKGRIVDNLQTGVVCGTYLRTYSQGHSGYGERAGYRATPLGSPIISITPSTNEMSVRWLRS